MDFLTQLRQTLNVPDDRNPPPLDPAKWPADPVNPAWLAQLEFTVYVPTETAARALLSARLPLLGVDTTSICEAWKNESAFGEWGGDWLITVSATFRDTGDRELAWDLIAIRAQRTGLPSSVCELDYA